MLLRVFVAAGITFSAGILNAKENKSKAPSPSADQINSRVNFTHDNEKPGTEKSQPKILKKGSNEPDLAYGAYQRGLYLTAFNHALPRAQIGDPAAQTLIAVLYEKGLGVSRNLKEATNWYKFAAKNGSHEAQFSYALKLLEGVHVPKDNKKAAALLKLAADAGHSAAQFNYGQIVLSERPTSRGIEEALSYFRKAADNGVADAYFAIFQILNRGYGTVAPDEVAAREVLINAALNNVENAQIELGIWLANGRGGEKDLEGAFAWFQIAALRGNVIAQNRLARMYVLGLGTEVKQEEAAKWYVLARRAGHKDAMLDDFYNSLKPEIRKKALSAANKWQPRQQPKWQLSRVLAKK